MKRIERVQDDVTRLLFDRVELSVLRLALGRPGQERDALLARVPLNAQSGTDGVATGLEALRSVGLVDAEDHLVEPAPATP